MTMCECTWCTARAHREECKAVDPRPTPPDRPPRPTAPVDVPRVTGPVPEVEQPARTGGPIKGFLKPEKHAFWASSDPRLCGICGGTAAAHHAAPTDAVNHPEHYTAGKVECIDALEAAVTGLEGPEAGLTWSSLKYLWRWKRKGGVEDLRKARRYLDRLIAVTSPDERR